MNFLKKRIMMNYSRVKIIFLLSFTFCSINSFAHELEITTSDSVQLYINVKGDGIPCLFIHGGPGQGSNYWEKLAGEFSEKHFKMIYLDQRGCGRSSSPINNDYSIERMIKDFEEVRKALNIKHWLVMGHSFGGVLQTYYAKVYPENIRGLLMFNCTLNLIESMENSFLPSVVNFFEIKNSSFYTDQSIPLPTRLDSVQKLFMTRDDVWKLSFSNLESAKKFGQTYADFETWNTDFSKIAFQIKDYEKDYAKLTGKINIPTLFLYGTKDKNVGIDYYLEVKFPKMILAKVEGGHMEFIENKKDYAKAIDSFLRRFSIN